MTSYNLYIDNGAGVFGAPISITTLTTLNYLFIGLNDIGTYLFMVSALNNIGEGQTSDPVPYIAADVPGAP